MNNNIHFVLQAGLYKEYEYGLPDDPGSMSRYIVHLIESNGFKIEKVEQ